jgi:catechol 2,3-dioxygenase-like lactoylglutathione lyase family enzyme
MLSNARCVATLAVSDIDRARRFYEEGLGLAVEADVVGTVRYSCGGTPRWRSSSGRWNRLTGWGPKGRRFKSDCPD